MLCSLLQQLKKLKILLELCPAASRCPWAHLERAKPGWARWEQQNPASSCPQFITPQHTGGRTTETSVNEMGTSAGTEEKKAASKLTGKKKFKKKSPFPNVFSRGWRCPQDLDIQIFTRPRAQHSAWNKFSCWIWNSKGQFSLNFCSTVSILFAFGFAKFSL